MKQHPDPDDDEIRHYLSGNLCRCAAYPEIVEAVKLAAAEDEGSRADEDKSKDNVDRGGMIMQSVITAPSVPWYGTLTRAQWKTLFATQSRLDVRRL